MYYTSQYQTALFRKLLKVLCTIQLHLADENGVKLDVFRWILTPKRTEKSKIFLKTPQKTVNPILAGRCPWQPQWHFLKARPAVGWKWRWSWSRRILGRSPSPRLVLVLPISPWSSEVATSETLLMSSTFAASLLIPTRRWPIWVPKPKNVSDLTRFPCEQLPWLTICSLFSSCSIVFIITVTKCTRVTSHPVTRF